MDLIPILTALAMAGAAPEAPAVKAPVPVALDPWRFKAFEYFRAVAFRGMVKGQMCGGPAVRARFEALSARLEKARARLSKQSSRNTLFDVKEDKVERAAQCSDGEAGMMLTGFERAVVTVEASAQ
ncbi:MAG TPA: hypothetical protein VHM92_01670 [Allosphingosinicella sp.]|nr:hypothetical protein [Allosphingosinicella sp.]